MMHAHFDAMKSEGANDLAPDLDKVSPSASFRGTPLQNHRIVDGNLEVCALQSLSSIGLPCHHSVLLLPNV